MRNDVILGNLPSITVNQAHDFRYAYLLGACILVLFVLLILIRLKRKKLSGAYFSLVERIDHHFSNLRKSTAANIKRRLEK